MTKAAIFLFHPSLIHNQAVPESKNIKALFHFSVGAAATFPAGWGWAEPGPTRPKPIFSFCELQLDFGGVSDCSSPSG